VKILRSSFALGCLSAALTVIAQAGSGGEFNSQGSSQSATTSDDTTHAGFPWEFETEVGIIGHSEVARGFRHVDDIVEVYTNARVVYTPRIKFGILRLGIAHERFGFSMSEPDFEVPRGLQSLTAIVGLDTKLGDSILVRFEAQPGLYSGTKLDGDDFHVPFILGGSYIYSDSLQFVLGVSVDYERSFPVIPGIGIRWRMGPQWVLNAVMPTPRLEYEVTKEFILYGGADLKGSTFRVDDRFGFERGNLQLNNAIVTYTEIRVGGGFQWKLSPEVKFSLEGGYLPYREFNFHRTNVRYHHEGGAPYVSASINAAF
jgi:hypothetical protein